MPPNTMPLIVPSRATFPAYDSLIDEQVYIMDRSRAEHQDIRPLRIGLLNLMPAAVREKTEIQFFRHLGNTPLQIEPFLVRFDEYIPNTGRERLTTFYRPVSQMMEEGLDGLIVTGANLERTDDGALLPFEHIHYYEELKTVLSWSKEHTASTLYSCLGSHIALSLFYNLERKIRPEKTFGVYPHIVHHEHSKELTQGMNDIVPVPHSRWGYIPKEEIDNHPELTTILENSYDDWHMAIAKGGREIFMQGHPEYDRRDLEGEYRRDKEGGQAQPLFYYPDGNESARPICNWQADASVFFRNWINFVYQHTNVDPHKGWMDT